MVYTWLIPIETQRFMHTWLRRRGISTSLVKLIPIVVKTECILFILNALYSSYQSCHALSKWINVSTMLFKYLTKLNSNWVIRLFWISHRKVNLSFLQIFTVGTTKMLYDLIYRYDLSKLVIQIYYGLVFYLVCVDYTMLLFTLNLRILFNSNWISE